MKATLFYLFSTIAIVSGILVVTLRNIMHSALLLVLALISIAGLFLLIGADFIATVQILVYAGGIMVLIVYAILLTQKMGRAIQPQTNRQKTPAFIFSVVVLVITGMAIKGTAFVYYAGQTAMEQGTVSTLGRALLTRYVLPFEIASLVILAAIIGVITIARKED